jgi:exodeoxyribonuclease-3
MGLRIDHILASQALIPQCIKCDIDKSQRAKERPSDHAPVVAEFYF